MNELIALIVLMLALPLIAAPMPRSQVVAAVGAAVLAVFAIHYGWHLL